MLKLVHLVLYLLKMSEGSERGFMHGRAFLEMNMLRQKSETHAACAHNVSAIRRFFTAHQTEHGRLPRAVSPDESDVLARINLHGCAPQDILRAVRFMNV
jgi:hypothetical protein